MYAYLLWDRDYQKRVLMVFDDKQLVYPDNYHVLKNMEISAIINYSKEKIVEGK